jgi:hypothetical protein
MKRVVASAVLLVWLLNCTLRFSTHDYHQYERGREITVSERIGEIVDAEERVRFGLFKGVEGFESASFHSIMQGGYEVLIRTTNGTFIAVNRDSQAVKILRDYIDSYETVLSWSNTFEKKWDIIDYDEIGFPITKNEVRLYSNPSASCACGAGSAAAVIGASVFIGALSIMSGGFLFHEPTDEEIRRANIILGAGIIAGVAAGLMVHHWQNTERMSKALEFIKDARRMRAVTETTHVP